MSLDMAHRDTSVRARAQQADIDFSGSRDRSVRQQRVQLDQLGVRVGAQLEASRRPKIAPALGGTR
jgi:hypothetical protein